MTTGHDAGDPVAVGKRKAGAKRRAVQDDLALKAVLDTRHGRRVLWGLLVEGGVYRQSYVASMPDATAFNEGRRSIGLQLVASIARVDPKAYGLMAAENTEQGNDDD